MKVITYNLHKGTRGHGKRQTSILAQAVHALLDRDPDLVTCQEVFHGITEALHQSRFITEILGHEHVFGPNVFYPRGCHGNATFARIPVARHVNVDITESYFEKRGMLRTWLQGEHGPFESLNVHFSLTGRQRRRQWSRLLQALPRDEDVPVIACGDFNDWTGALDRRARESGLLENALWRIPRRHRLTFPANRPVLALDRIYVRGFEVRDACVLTGEPWADLSDHLPIEVELIPR